jgi:hypothetical protein
MHDNTFVSICAVALLTVTCRVCVANVQVDCYPDAVKRDTAHIRDICKQRLCQWHTHTTSIHAYNVLEFRS